MESMDVALATQKALRWIRLRLRVLVVEASEGTGWTVYDCTDTVERHRRRRERRSFIMDGDGVWNGDSAKKCHLAAFCSLFVIIILCEHLLLSCSDLDLNLLPALLESELDAALVVLAGGVMNLVALPGVCDALLGLGLG